ncbi:MAG: hypothetical protein ACU0BK_09005 [Shimia sp.]|uniref:hypothetical protein n=1 Tax=Shimia sp. TaxID=1954381 RepID=UPI0040589E8D
MKLGAQESLDRDGFYILKSAMSRADVRTMREAILKQKDKMAVTRTAAHSRHLAGFHRYKHLADVHETLANNATLQETLAAHFGAGNAKFFGLSDITINRSQHWHTDL